MAYQLQQQVEDVRPVPVLRQRLPDVLRLATQLADEGRLHLSRLIDRLVIAVPDADGACYFVICLSCGACSPELLAVSQISATCPVCEERRLAERQLARLAGTVSTLHEAHATACSRATSPRNPREGAA
jgi:hypothetical protein